MRDQWVANLKKKRMANGGDSGSAGSVRMSSVGIGIPAESGNIAAGRRHHNTTLEKNINAHHRNQHKHSQFATVDSLIMNSQFGDSDGMIHPGMLFNDVGFFEVESQSFAQVSPPPPQPAKPSRSRAKGGAKRNTKTVAKKRMPNHLMLDVNQPKPRTPRRKLNTGDAFFDDCSSLSMSAPTGSSLMSMAANCGRPSSAGYSSVGTPSNFNAEIRHMWGPEFDFGSNGAAFADTFLDLPTPKSAEMPFVTASCQPYVSARRGSKVGKSKPKGDDDELDQPRLIRTTSIEQEGLSHFLEQTNLDGSSNHGEELFQLIATPKAQSPLRHRSKSLNSASLSLSTYAADDMVEHSGAAYSSSLAAAAGAAVNECFSKMMPSPMSKDGLLFTTPRGIRRTPKGWYSGDFSFDQKGGAPEFETLLDEYKLSDIDQELDSFYLDAMESLGGELDLLSN